MPPCSWIRLPQFFSAEMPLRGPLKLWLQHADCDTPATEAEAEAVKAELTEGTNGQAIIETGAVCHFAKINGTPQILV